MEARSFIPFLTELAAKSGEFIRPLFANPDVAVESKSDNTPVTIADRGAEELMREMIQDRYPDHGIIGEEFGSERADAEWVWVLDPVDGTRSFAAGCPLFGTLIALKHAGHPVLGCIHQPVLGQLCIGDGQSTTLNGRAVRVRDCDTIGDALLLGSDPFTPEEHQDGAAFDRLARHARLYRTWGDCYGYILLAGGWADIMTDAIMNPWDIQALIPIVRGAGGVITDWQGKDPVDADSIVAAGPAIHSHVIAVLNS